MFARLAIGVLLLAAIGALAATSIVLMDAGETTIVGCDADELMIWRQSQTSARLVCVHYTPTPPPDATITPTETRPPVIFPTITPTPTRPPSVGLDPRCTATLPLGALAPATNIWCHFPLNTGPSTLVGMGDSWLDEWEHGLTFADLGAGYASGDFGGVCDAQHWRHNAHWMVDVRGCGHGGGGWMRPDRTFTAQNGKLVVETESTTNNIPTYDTSDGGDIWTEVTVSTGAKPSGGDLYLYDALRGHWTFGCRMHDLGLTCALLDNTFRSTVQGGRVWEVSWFQCGAVTGGDCSGGGPYGANAGVWKECATAQDPDINCRNKFRFEITASTLDVYVNGHLYFHNGHLPPGLDNLVGGQNVYVYNGSVVYKESADSVRFHWDHFAVNPGAAPAAATVTPTPTRPSSAPTATRTPAGGRALRIMPLGDSITAGQFGDASYRQPLWNMLTSAGKDVDFVGTLNSGQPSLDADHEGHSGFGTGGILTNVVQWASAAQPDVVLLHAGTVNILLNNSGQDESESIAASIGLIIDALRGVNPSVRVLVAEVIPAAGHEQQMLAFNLRIAALAAAKQVTLIDQYSGFDASTDTVEGVHPNAAGAVKMASRWYAALR